MAATPERAATGHGVNSITTASSIEALMSSVEIAKLCKKRHDNLIIDIERMLVDLELGVLNFQGTYTSQQGKEIKCYYLPKRECIILVSGYNVKMRAAIVDEWQNREKSQAPKLPKTFSEALRLAADMAEQNQLLIPKAKALH